MQSYHVLSDRCKHMLDLDRRESSLPNSSNGVNRLLINLLAYEHISWPRSFEVRSKLSAAWAFLRYTAHSWSLLEEHHCSDKCLPSGGLGPQMRAAREQPAERVI